MALGKLRLRGGIWHYRLNINGVRYEHSTHTKSRNMAERYLRKIIEKSGQGYLPSEDQITLADMVRKITNEHQGQELYLRTLGYLLKPVYEFFGENARAIDITTERIDQYIAGRLKTGLKRSSLGRELSVLRHAFALTTELSRKPRIVLKNVDNPRTEFLEPGDFRRIRELLPERLRDVISFIYLSHKRQGQVVQLEWRDVNRERTEVNWRRETVKTRQAEMTPLVGEMKEIIERAYLARRLDCPYVFHRDGEMWSVHSNRSPLKKGWKRAATAAGFPNHTLHCTRRSAIRDTVRATGDPMLAMAMSGHRSMAMLRRYNIIDSKDLLRAVEKTEQYRAEQTDSKVRKIG